MVTCRLAVAEQPGRARDGHLSLAALLAGAEPVGGPARRQQPAAEVRAARPAGLDRDALAGEAAALAGFRTGVGVPVPVTRSRYRRPPLLPSLLPARAAPAAAAAAL